jgi:integrase
MEARAMARKANAFPELKFHSPTKQFCVYINGRRKTLGRDQATAEANHRRIVAKLATGEPTASSATARPQLADPSEVTVAEILASFAERVRPRWIGSSDLARVDATIRHLDLFAGDELARDFRKTRLEEFRRYLIKQKTTGREPSRKGKRGKLRSGHAGRPYSRTWINYLIGIAKQIFAWAADEDLMSSEQAAKIWRLKPLRRGQGGRETLKVPPVPESVVAATVPELSPVVRALVQIQQLTGARPGEIVCMRRRDISTTAGEPVRIPNTSIDAIAANGVWFYVPASHKNIHRGKPRVLALGPRAQEVLRPFVAGRRPDDSIFSPEEAYRWHLERNERCTDYLDAGGSVRDQYDSKTYGRAVSRAIKRINEQRFAEGPLALLPHWSPGQIRHTTATDVRARFGRETAAEFLGHSGLEMIDRYAEQALETAARIATAIG